MSVTEHLAALTAPQPPESQIHHTGTNALPSVQVWDRFVRISHWIVALACSLAWLTHGGLVGIHRIAGYVDYGFGHCAIDLGFY